MRKGLRFRLRSFEFRRCGKFDKKNRSSLVSYPWRVMCRSPYKTSIILVLYRINSLTYKYRVLWFIDSVNKIGDFRIPFVAHRED
jgi:hypothetical protein